MSLTITTFIAIAKTSHEAWKKLNTLYASRSRTWVVQLQEDLFMIHHWDRSRSANLLVVKALADEIFIIDHPISDNHLTLCVLHS